MICLSIWVRPNRQILLRPCSQRIGIRPKLRLPFEQNSATIKQYLQGLTKPYFQQPGFSNLRSYTQADEAANLPLMRLDNITGASDLVLLKAKLLHLGGDSDQAIELYRANIHVGLAVANSQGGIITYLVAGDVIQDSLSAIKDFVASQKLTNEQKAKLKVLLNDSSLDTRAGAAEALKGEYYIESSYFQ